MNYQEYIRTELLILVPVLYIAGKGLKKSKIPDHKIPLLLGCMGVILSSVWIVATSEIRNMQEFFSAAFTAVTQGVLAAGASVYANQLYVQAQKAEKVKDGTRPLPAETNTEEEFPVFPQQDTFPQNTNREREDNEHDVPDEDDKTES